MGPLDMPSLVLFGPRITWVAYIFPYNLMKNPQLSLIFPSRICKSPGRMPPMPPHMILQQLLFLRVSSREVQRSNYWPTDKIYGTCDSYDYHTILMCYGYVLWLYQAISVDIADVHLPSFLKNVAKVEHHISSKWLLATASCRFSLGSLFFFVTESSRTVLHSYGRATHQPGPTNQANHSQVIHQTETQ